MAESGRPHTVREAYPFDLQAVQSVFGERLALDAPVARFTSARVGGPARGMVKAESAEDLAEITIRLWEIEVPFVIIGGGSNILVSDRGLSGMVVLNRARRVRFDTRHEPPSVWVESGANFGSLARQAAARGFSGLEWAAGIPGTLGGAIAGNAGAHGGDIAGQLLLADILHQVELENPQNNGHRASHHPVREAWTADRFQFAYRSSVIKERLRQPTITYQGTAPALASPGPQTIVLAAWLTLEQSTRQAVNARMEEYLNYRRATQPSGASMGSMFKNPAGDFAGRLIEAAGLKGLQVGKAQISPLHANFFINLGGASAAEIWQLIRTARDQVAEKFGVELELEIELIGDWPVEDRQ